MGKDVGADVAAERPHRSLPLLALVLATACWGTSLVMTKAVVDQIPPFSTLFIQLVASTSLLWTWVALRRIPVRISRNTIRGSLPGILEPGLAYAACVWGLTRTNASSAAIILASEPLFIVLLAWLLYAARPSARTAVLLLTGLVGVVLVSVPNQAAAVGGAGGNALVAIGTVSAALYVVLSSRSVLAVDARVLVTLQQTMGLAISCVFLIIGFAMGAETWPAHVSVGTLLVCMLSGVMQYALAFSLYLYGLKHVPVSTAATLLSLTPIFAICASTLCLGETLDTRQWLGCVVVMAAAILLCMTV